jgi:steroid delta-isomerase-like uncharacterized protein
MTPEENKAIRRRYYEEAWSTKDPSVLDRYISPSVVDHGTREAPVEGWDSSIDGVKQRHAALYAAFPDAALAIEDMLADGDRVVTRFTVTGTHQGEFMGVPATGKQVSFGGIDSARMEDGMLMEHWLAVDMMGLLQQLGAVSPPAR